MADSFSVDTKNLEQIRALLEGPQTWLAGQHTGTTGTSAATAAGPARTAVAAFAGSLDRFLVAGAAALASDLRAVDANRAGYERSDLGAAERFGALR